MIREQLEGAIRWADLVLHELGELQLAEGHRVHFRPTSSGVSLIGLQPDAPQLGRGGFKDLARLRDRFEELFERHCTARRPCRPTPKKALQ